MDEECSQHSDNKFSTRKLHRSIKKKKEPDKAILAATHSDTIINPNLLSKVTGETVYVSVKILSNAPGYLKELPITLNALVDSGATHHSYISRTVVEKYPDFFAPHTTTDNDPVAFADETPGKGGQRLQHVTLKIYGPLGKEHKILNASLTILDNVTKDIYIGNMHMCTRIPELKVEQQEFFNKKFKHQIKPDILPTPEEIGRLNKRRTTKPKSQSKLKRAQVQKQECASDGDSDSDLPSLVSDAESDEELDESSDQNVYTHNSDSFFSRNLKLPSDPSSCGNPARSGREHGLKPAQNFSKFVHGSTGSARDFFSTHAIKTTSKCPSLHEIYSPDLSFDFANRTIVEQNDTDSHLPIEEQHIPDVSSLAPIDNKTDEEKRLEYLDAVQEYIVQLQNRNDPHLTPGIIKRFEKLMTSDKAIHVFVPRPMTGVLNKDGDPIYVNLKFKQDMAPSRHARCRYVSPEKAQIQIEQMELFASKNICFLSPHCTHVSPTVMVPKKTAPWWRIAVDFKQLNEDIIPTQAHVPEPRDIMAQLKNILRLNDLDMRNAFHQLLLAAETAIKCGITTPGGVYQPNFMWEGVTPASAELQNYLATIFRTYEHIIQIHDNFLTTHRPLPEELKTEKEREAFALDLALKQLELMIDICHKHNIQLSFEKSDFLLRSVDFFGYKANAHGYSVEQKKIDRIKTLPIPRSKKECHSSLGLFVYGKPFIPGYTKVMQPLYDMLHKDFQWNAENIAKKEQDWQDAVDAFTNMVTLAYHDYNLEWIILPDWCPTGV